MFDLEREIDRFTDRVLAGQCDGAENRERRAELRDHVASDVERLMAEGLPVEDAFRAATLRLGPVEELAREYRKNRSWLAKLAHRGEPEPGAPSPGRVAWLVIAQSAIWAAVMVAAALELRGTGAYERISTYLVAGWFVSFSLLSALPDYRRTARAECAFFRRLFGAPRRA